MENDISVLSFVYNEENNIADWINNLKPYVKEIIIFDLESTDKTYEICKSLVDTVYIRPHLICGDSYKQELQYLSKGAWLLWSYPDERLTESTSKVLDKLLKQDRWNAYAFMRHEYMDDVRVCFQDRNKKIVAFGTPDCPNYQCRLHRNDGKIFYTEMVHAEIHGNYQICNLPPEYAIEHYKTSSGQEFDNQRLYIYYKFLVWKYAGTKLDPYKKYVDSYLQIIKDSESANLSGNRKVSYSEEFWWNWKKYAHMKRISLEEFKQTIGISYEEFINSNKYDFEAKIIIEPDIVDPILSIRNE